MKNGVNKKEKIKVSLMDLNNNNSLLWVLESIEWKESL